MQTNHVLTHLPRVSTEVVATVGTPGVNVFGPQTHWSSLLSQRERLEIEIHHSKKYLEQLRKDLAADDALVEGTTASGQEAESVLVCNFHAPVAASGAMEHSLLDWLQQLEERQLAVIREIEALEAQCELEPSSPEESMFELLRAAG